MLIVRLTHGGSPQVLEIELEGDITEGSDIGAQFSTLNLPTGLPLRIACARVRYINSVGIRQWVLLFEGYRMDGTRLIFHGCSPAIVSQFNLMANFIRRNELESMQLPYLCSQCKREQLVELAIHELRVGDQTVIPKPPCGSCATPLTFDENPTEYLHFLS